MKSDEVHLQKAKKKDHGRHSEEGQEKQDSTKKRKTEDNCPDERELIKKQKKSKKDKEHTVLFGFNESIKELKEKNKDKFSDRKRYECTTHFAALNEGRDFKEISDSFSSSKKKKKQEEEREIYFAQVSEEMDKSVLKHKEKARKSKKEISVEGDLKIACSDGSVDNRQKRRKQKGEPEREYSLDIGRRKKEDAEVLVGDNDQVSELTDVVKKKKKKKKFDYGDNVDNSKKTRKRKAEPEEEYTLDVDNRNENEANGESEVVKKKKKKKAKDDPGENSKPAIHPGLSYLRTWNNDQQNWNFKKVRQVWLLQNMFDQQQVSKAKCICFSFSLCFPLCFNHLFPKICQFYVKRCKNIIDPLKDIKPSLTAQGAGELFVTLIADKFFSWLPESPFFSVESPCYIFVVQHIYSCRPKGLRMPISA